MAPVLVRIVRTLVLIVALFISLVWFNDHRGFERAITVILVVYYIMYELSHAAD